MEWEIDSQKGALRKSVRVELKNFDLVKPGPKPSTPAAGAKPTPKLKPEAAPQTEPGAPGLRDLDPASPPSVLDYPSLPPMAPDHRAFPKNPPAPSDGLPPPQASEPPVE
jgi:hypothetical protein